MASNEEIAGRLKAFALMLKYGHDLFNTKSFADTASIAVNNSRALLNFSTSALFMLINGKAELIGQFGQVESNPYSRLAVVQKKLVESLKFTEDTLTLDSHDELPGVYFCIKLTPPAYVENSGIEFVWLLEFENEIPPSVPNTAKLLSSSMSEALYFQKLCKNSGWKVKHHAKKRWFWGVMLLVLIGTMFIRVPENATAEFTLKAPQISHVYAWFDGPIAKCFKQDGDLVKKGDLIAEYDTAQLLYRINVAKASLQEVEAELALEQQNSFIDQEKLGKVKLLEARRNTMQVSVKEALWYLTNSKLSAPSDGVLALVDGRAEQLTGKAVRTGDKIFEVFSGRGMVAEIPVNERDASVLREKIRATLFLHTAPETAIPVEILEVSRYPELTEQRTYCYKVRVKLPENMNDLRYGMRGIAKLSGEEVSLGYYLFKSAVLYFRGL